MLNPKLAAAMLEEEKAQFDKRKSCEALSEDSFVQIGKDMLKDARIYELNYDKDKDPVKWKILADGKHIHNCA
jgi:hypothetical protein